MSDKTKAALQGRQCQNSNQIHSQLITHVDHVKRCSDLSNGTVTGFPVSLSLAGGCLSYISGDTTSPKFLGSVFPVVCSAGILTAPLAQFAKASRNLNQRRNSALGDIENYHLQNILHLLTQIFGSVGSVPHRNTAQPFGSMPRLSNSLRKSRFIHPALLSSPSSFIAIDRRSERSGSRRSCTTFLSLWFSLVDIGIHPFILIIMVINVHHCKPISKAPQVLGTHAGLLTTNAKATSEAAMNNHITPLNGRNSLTLNKFTWRFLALNRHDKKAKPCRLSVEATTEHEARRILAPHFILSFAARLPVQEVRHV